MEVECKVRVQDDEVGLLRERLDRLGAFQGESEQVDTYFHHPARDLVATDEAFRLRSDRGFELTYKGARLPGDLKQREELNVRVASDPTAMLQALGFRAAARLAKRRATWSMPGCHVTLDHIEGLGWFIEVEADGGEADPGRAIDRTRRALGLHAGQRSQTATSAWPWRATPEAFSASRNGSRWAP